MNLYLLGVVEKFRHADKEYDVRATFSPERVNEAGKRVDALLRFQVLIDGQEYRFSLFVPWVSKLIDGTISEVYGVLLKDKPDWKENGRVPRYHD
jgi:hypothetical protein